jgi:hypothetical protein|tara:strand:- start:609 stop:1061 length:453 start_codon:yes stop_codon:yes gene_type:complete
MSIEYQIDDRSEVVFVLMAGEISALEVMKFLTRVNAEQRDGRYDRLIMLRNTKCLLSGSEVAEIAEFAYKLHGSRARHCTAVVVSSACEFGIARQYQLYRDPPPDAFNIFKDLNEAVTWLELDSGSVSTPMGSNIFGIKEPLYHGNVAAG